MKKTHTLLLVTLLAILCGKMNAQILTDRPDQTESSSTVPKRALQLESGVLISYETNNLINTRQILLPTNLFRYGIADWIEIRLLSQLEMLKTNGQQFEGISDLEIGTKIQLLKNESLKTQIAFLSHLVIPTGSIELTSNNYGTINKFSISHQISKNVGIGYNLGYKYFGKGNGDITYSLSLGIGINENVGIYLEPYGEVANVEKFISNFDAGFTYLANENLQFDFSFGTGLNHRMNYISIGFSWLIEKG